MHEYSVTQSLMELALAKAGEAGAKRITRINLVIGEMSGVVSDCVQTYFELLRRDTIASQAELAFETAPTRLRCRHCRNVFSPRELDWSCPSCHEAGVEIISGRECYMESIEVA